MTVTLSRHVIADEGFAIANYAKHYGISTIFLDVAGDDIGLLATAEAQESANLHAMIEVASVYVVTGDPSWLDKPASVPSDVATIVGTIAPKFPGLAGMLYNIKPKATQRGAYFRLLDTLFEGPQQYRFKTTLLATVPAWQRYPNGHGTRSPSMLQQAERYAGVSGTYLQMNGGSSAEQMSTDVTEALPQLEKPYWSGANAYSPDGSYFGSSAGYLARNLERVASDVVKFDSNLAGISVAEWQDRYGSLQTILPQPTPEPVPPPVGRLTPPGGTLYLGAYVSPSSGPGAGGGAAGLADFESAIGRKLAYDLHFSSWSDAFNPYVLRDDAANGRVPLVALDCGDTDAHVAAGADDGVILAQAAAAKAYHHPIFLRYFWEFNLPAQSRRSVCYDPETDLPDNRFSPVLFKEAWRHMHQLYREAGATNVIWVWNESGSGQTPAEYYPGSDFVDWVGVDYYDRTDVPFLENEAPSLNATAQYGKPTMLCETAANAGYQPQYLSQIARTFPFGYPLVEAVSIFDAAGGPDGGDWSLTPSGVGQFTKLGRLPAFSAFAPVHR
jgi:hypothetical protein